MKSVIRTLMALVCFVAISMTVKAGEDRLFPNTFNSGVFATTYKLLKAKVDLAFHTDEAAKKPKTSLKVCACQILDLESKNFEHSNVAIFSEKTNYGDISSDLDAAKEVLETEKKHLNKLFFTKMKVVSKTQDATDCSTLARKLKSDNTELKVYDVIDADQRVQIKK